MGRMKAAPGAASAAHLRRGAAHGGELRQAAGAAAPAQILRHYASWTTEARGGQSGEMIEMDSNDWVAGLLEELKRKSSSNWGAGKRPFAAMPNTIARIIKSHSDKTKPELRRSYYESAKAHFDELVRHGDPYAKTLRRASTELSELLSEAN